MTVSRLVFLLMKQNMSKTQVSCLFRRLGWRWPEAGCQSFQYLDSSNWKGLITCNYKMNQSCVMPGRGTRRCRQVLNCHRCLTACSNVTTVNPRHSYRQTPIARVRWSEMIWEHGWEDAAFAVACKNNTNRQIARIVKSSAKTLRTHFVVYIQRRHLGLIIAVLGLGVYKFSEKMCYFTHISCVCLNICQVQITLLTSHHHLAHAGANAAVYTFGGKQWTNMCTSQRGANP